MTFKAHTLWLALGLSLTLGACSNDQPENQAKPTATQTDSHEGAASQSVETPSAAATNDTASAPATPTNTPGAPWDSAALTRTLSAMPSGDVTRGEQAHNALLCVSCHAVTGQPNSRNFVNLNHQPENYVKKVLIDYRDDRRAEPYGQSKIMTYIAKTLTDQQIADLAAFYSAQPLPKGKQADYQAPSAISQLVAQGDMTRMVMSCAACHGAQGQGNGDLFPALAGQEVDYTIRTLKAYRSGERHNDVNQMMGNIAKQLTDEEIAGLAQYYANLNP
ncbi:MAG: cytochrome c [Thiomicrospira sp.]